MPDQSDGTKTCALCGEAGDIRCSHIVPKFFSRQLKHTSPTGRLVSAASPTKRRQDTEKVHMLCDRCEERFSKHETWFANNVFHPFYSGSREFTYDHNLGLFATSLSWRSLKRSYDEVKASPHSHLAPLIDDAERHWRDLLLGKRQTNPYENHLLFLGDVDGGPLDGDDRYKFCAIDSTLCTSGNRVFAYAQMPHMLIVTAVFPLNMEGWQDTLIKARGKMTTSQTIDDDGFREFYRERSHAALTCAPGPSDAQVRTRLEEALKDPPRVMKSQMYQIWLKEADADLKKRVAAMPKAVRDLVQRVILGSVVDANASDEHNLKAVWAGRHIADRLANLSGDEARELDRAIVEAVDESTTTQEYARRAWNTSSLKVVFMVHHNATRERQHAKIRDELENLRRQTPSEIPIGVFSMNDEGDGCSFESGFSVSRPTLSH